MLNKVILMGRLTAAPEISYTQSETAVCRYNLAVQRKYKKDGEAEADFIRCICFGKTAEFAKNYLSKGAKIVVVGRIQTGRYEKDNGDTVFTTDVIVDEHYFCESKSGNTTGKTNTPPQSVPQNKEEFIYVEDDKLPF